MDRAEDQCLAQRNIAFTMRMKIANRIWSLDFVKASQMQSRQNWGECDLPTARKPTMIVRRSLQPKAMLNVTVHEMLHACRPELSEEAVRETADVIAGVLYKLGARITPPSV